MAVFISSCLTPSPPAGLILEGFVVFAGRGGGGTVLFGPIVFSGQWAAPWLSRHAREASSQNRRPHGMWRCSWCMHALGASQPGKDGGKWILMNNTWLSVCTPPHLWAFLWWLLGNHRSRERDRQAWSWTLKGKKKKQKISAALSLEIVLLSLQCNVTPPKRNQKNVNCQSWSVHFMLKWLTSSVFCIISDRKSIFPTDLELIYALPILNCDFLFVTGDDDNSPHSDLIPLSCFIISFFSSPCFRDTLVSHVSEDPKTAFLHWNGIVIRDRSLIIKTDEPRSGLKCASVDFFF